MKVIFVHFLTDVAPSYSHAIASVASCVHEAGHNVELVTVRTQDIEDVANRIISASPEIVSFSVMSNQWLNACSLASLLKQHSANLCLVVGGSHVNASPYTIEASPFDFACFGEGEHALVELLGSIASGRKAPDVAWITPDSFRLPQQGIVEELDALPLPLIQLFEQHDVLAYPSVMFSRGCPFHCTYCMSRAGGVGHKVRWKSPQRAIEETVGLVSYFDPPELYFDDDTFLKNPRWVRTFLTSYRQRVGVPFYCNARPEVVTLELAQLLVGSGCQAIGIGIESGSERIRREILDRQMSNDDIKRAFDSAHKAGLETWSFNMIGLPTETTDDLVQTIELNRMVNTNYLRISVYTPYPGTILGEMTSSNTSPQSYFATLSSLRPEMYEIASTWVAQLRKDGRLWNDD